MLVGEWKALCTGRGKCMHCLLSGMAAEGSGGRSEGGVGWIGDSDGGIGRVPR